METNAVATINNVAIVIIDEKEKMVPIKPICEALGIDYKTQHEKISNHYLLASTMGNLPTVAADGKQREMACIPFKYVFGWLFSINAGNVKEEIREAVEKYQTECYDALFNYFTEPNTFLAYKQELIEEKLVEYDKAKDGFKFAKNIMDEKRKEFEAVRQFSIEEWRANKGQFRISFPKED